MANPRKFSEKIALHNQKQAEETAAFEQIMREVIGATRVPTISDATPVLTLRNNHLHINQSVGTCRAGSLPNVNHIGAENNSIDLQSALNNLDDIRHGREPRERRTASPSGFGPVPSSMNRSSVHQPGQHGGRYSNVDQKRSDTRSPYSQPYLSPPDLSWRRTNSDSALHQSAMLAEQQDHQHHYSTSSSNGSPSSPRRTTVHTYPVGIIMSAASGQQHIQSNSISPHLMSSIASWDPGKGNHGMSHHQQQQILQQDYGGGNLYSTSPEQTVLLPPSMGGDGDGGSRPKSCEVPGITLYPTQEDHGHSNNNHNHPPLSSNTGSLPDLTNLHFPAPLATPIDADDQSGQQQMANNNQQQQHNASMAYQQQQNNNSAGPNSPLGSYVTSAPPPSPYSTASNCGSPYSPQSPNSVNSAFSPPPVAVAHHHYGGGVVYEATAEGGIKASTLNNLNSMSNGIPTQPNQNTGHNQLRHHVGYSNSSRNSTSPMITVEGLTVDTSALSLGGNSTYSDIDCSQSGGNNQEQQHSVFTEASSRSQQTNVHRGQTYASQPMQQLSEQQQSMGLHRSTTPSEHSCSAPTSPISHTISPLNSPGLPPQHSNGPTSTSNNFQDGNCYNLQQTQNQLEQFKMVHDLQGDNEHLLMMPDSVVHSSSSSASSSTGGLYMNSVGNTVPQSPRGSLGDGTCDYSPQPSPQSNYVVTSGMNDLQSSSVFYSTPGMLPLNNVQGTMSPSIYSKSVISSAPSTYQVNRQPTHSPAPQTPTSIPDIILTDANSEESLLRQDFVKDLGSSSMSDFETNDLFSSDAFKSDIPIDPIDFDGLQILTEMTDSQGEESFRLDRS